MGWSAGKITRGWNKTILFHFRGFGEARILSWLVVWNMNGLFFHSEKGMENHPNWPSHIFQRGRLNHQPVSLTPWFFPWWYSIPWAPWTTYFVGCLELYILNILARTRPDLFLSLKWSSNIASNLVFPSLYDSNLGSGPFQFQKMFWPDIFQYKIENW